MVAGVTAGYEKKSRSAASATAAGLAARRTSSSRSATATRSTWTAPEGITFNVEAPTRFSVIGIDKQQVGEVAANIRSLRKPEPWAKGRC